MVNSVKLLIAVIVVLVIIGISILGKRLKFFFDFQSIKLRKSESFWILLLAVFFVLFTAVAEWVRFQPKASWLTFLGLLIFAGGVFFNFKVVQQKLKFDIKKCLKYSADGIYKKIRYPGYSALLIILLGLLIVLNSLWALLLFLVLLIPAILFRIAQEDAALADMNPDRFELYSSETKRIIPDMF